MVYKKNKLLFGVGVNDADYPVRPVVDGKQRVMCVFYRVWSNMLMRCYCDKYIKNKPSYTGCSVEKGWLVFSNFKSWMEKQDYKGKCLDKDILIKGNKVYGEETCIFVDQRINQIIVQMPSLGDDLPLGVSINRNSKRRRYVAKINIDGKGMHIGTYNTVLEASSAYIHARNDRILKECLYLSSSGLYDLSNALRRHVIVV